MGDEISHNRVDVKLDGLSKPATVLIQKVSEAIGGIFKPHQIIRIAQAQAEARKIEAASKIEVTGLQQRALQRFVVEETKKQFNIESIVAKALPEVKTDSQPENIEDDWITNFFDKCRLISDDQMQSLWAKVLAGEANLPGQYSKRTVAFLTTLDKQDALLFKSLCSFAWDFGKPEVLIFKDLYENEYDKIYTNRDIRFETLAHLDTIGLITLDYQNGYKTTFLPDFYCGYYGQYIALNPSGVKTEFTVEIGSVLLTKVGEELATICGSEPVDGFIDKVLKRWLRKGYAPATPYPRVVRL